MEFSEFDRLAEPLRVRSARAEAEYGVTAIEGRTATEDELVAAERRLGVVLPAQYRAFMMRYGGGMFGFVDLIPVAAGPGDDDVVSVSRHENVLGAFVPVAPVGTGDYWGFPVAGGRCSEQVWCFFHDGDEPEPEAEDFLAFVARRGLKPA